LATEKTETKQSYRARFIIEIDNLELFELKHLPEELTRASIEAFEQIALF
jgi:hypothetical protein